MIITLQPASRTDHITPEGLELTQKPYPMHVNERGWLAPGTPYSSEANRVVGFTADLARQHVDLKWDDFVDDDPQRAVGMYVITEKAPGRFSTWEIAIETVTVHDSKEQS